MSFLTISNEIIFFKTQGTRLGTIVACYKGLEWCPANAYRNFEKQLRENSFASEAECWKLTPTLSSK